MPAPLDPTVIDAIASDVQRGFRIARVAKEHGVSETTVRTVLKATAAADRPGARERVLRYVADHGPLSSHRDLNERVVDVGYHPGVHILYRLRRAGLVEAREEHRGKQTWLREIKVTRAGLAQLNGSDPVQIRTPQPRPQEAAPVTEPVPAPAPAPQAKPRLVDGLVPTLVDRLRAEAWADTAPIGLLEERYPLLAQLLRRDESLVPLREAARLLESAGKDDLALRVLEEAKELTPEQVQIVAFLRAGLSGR